MTTRKRGCKGWPFEDREDKAEYRQIADCGCTHSPCPCESLSCPYYGASCNLCPVHAAGPDLLAALEAVISLTEGWQEILAGLDDFDEGAEQSVIDQARAAIAQAKGKAK